MWLPEVEEEGGGIGENVVKSYKRPDRRQISTRDVVYNMTTVNTDVCYREALLRE